ncbi:MAG: alpha/beta fold hydrolase [Alphaproteobacteria bacterium]
MAARKSPTERRRFPRVPVYTQIRVILRHQQHYRTAEVGNISAEGLMVKTDEPLENGALVDFEFILLDEVHPYVGQAEVVWIDGPDKNKQWSIGLHFHSISIKAMGLRDFSRRVTHFHSVSFNIALDALRYAWMELQGNLTERELGQPGAGFRRPLLLIHGWFGTRGALLLMERWLKKKGFPVFSVNLGMPNVQDIEQSARQVTDKVVSLSERLGLAKINILAHSMGGLIGLWALKKLTLADYVQRFVTVGAPFHGTYVSATGLPLFGLLGKSLWQMLPNSPFLKRLHQGALPTDVGIYCVAARNDLLVPLNSAILEGANNVMVEGSHAALVTSEKIFKRILAVLEGKDPFA